MTGDTVRGENVCPKSGCGQLHREQTCEEAEMAAVVLGLLAQPHERRQGENTPMDACPLGTVAHEGL